MVEKFQKSFTQQLAIPEAGIVRAVEILRSGRLHRYNMAEGEESETSRLEAEYADYQGVDYCLAVTSGGQAIQLALRVCDVNIGDKVLANAYTLAPVPGAIHQVGAKPVLIEIDENYHIDCDHLAQQAERTGSRVLLLSHMRGHIADMERVMEVARHYDLRVIEDCAHTMGAKWAGRRSGNFGDVAAFSTQTYKHMNSGEGGFLTTNDAKMAARAVVHSGSYMLYQRHGAIPPQQAFDSVHDDTANFSCRMDHLRAAIIRAQLPLLDENIARWNVLYDRLFARFSDTDGLSIPERRQQEFYVGSSIQFRVEQLDKEQIPDFLARCATRGVDLKWFGADTPTAFTSRYDSWKYIVDLPELPATQASLEKTMDMRIPLIFTAEDCDCIARIIAQEIARFVS